MQPESLIAEDTMGQFLTDSIQRLESIHQASVDSIMNALIAAQHSEYLRQVAIENEAHDQFIRILSTIVGVVIFGSFFLYNYFNNKYWESGVFPPMLLNRKINHYEAIVNISANIMLCDKDNYADKQRSLSQFLRKQFPGISGGMQDSLKSALSMRVNVESTAYWMNKHIRHAEEKNKLLGFFFSLATIDGVIGKKEFEILEIFSSKMNIAPSVLQQMADKQRRARGERMYNEQERSRQAKTVTTSGYRIEKAAAILGLPAKCTMEEVKKAYRKLAMKHHPDKFQNETVSAREQAGLRFLEVQQAYEYLEQELN